MAPSCLRTGCPIRYLSASLPGSATHRESFCHGLRTVRLAPRKLVLALSLAALPLLAEPVSPPDSSPSALDIQQAKALVAKFCTAWKALKLDSMYAMLSEAAKASLARDVFGGIYGAAPDKSGRLLSWKVKDAAGGDGGVVVKAELRFGREKLPTAVNGVHSFHMAKGEGKWRVKAVVPPIPPPVAQHGVRAEHAGDSLHGASDLAGDGGHPGE